MYSRYIVEYIMRKVPIYKKVVKYIEDIMFTLYLNIHLMIINDAIPDNSMLILDSILLYMYRSFLKNVADRNLYGL